MNSNADNDDISGTLDEYCYNVITINNTSLLNSSNNALMEDAEEYLTQCSRKGLLTKEQKERFNRFFKLRHSDTKITYTKSDDNRLLIYSYDAGLGGTMTQFDVFAEIHDGNVVTTVNLNDDKYKFPVTALHTVKKKDGSVYYLAVCIGNESSTHGLMYAKAYVIDGNKLQKVGVKDGLKDDANSDFLPLIEYDSAEWYYTCHLDVDGAFDFINSKLYVPITTNDKYAPLLTDRYKVYFFNGTNFVEQGESANPYLYSSLSNYDQLVRYRETDNRVVRVDLMKDGTLRYAEWKNSDDHLGLTSSKPVRVIINGKKVEDENGTEYRFCDDDGTEYVVCHTECVNTKSAGIMSCTEYILATKNGKQIFKEQTNVKE